MLLVFLFCIFEFDVNRGRDRNQTAASRLLPVELCFVRKTELWCVSERAIDGINDAARCLSTQIAAPHPPPHSPVSSGILQRWLCSSRVSVIPGVFLHVTERPGFSRIKCYRWNSGVHRVLDENKPNGTTSSGGVSSLCTD